MLWLPEIQKDKPSRARRCEQWCHVAKLQWRWVYRSANVLVVCIL